MWLLIFILATGSADQEVSVTKVKEAQCRAALTQIMPDNEWSGVLCIAPDGRVFAPEGEVSMQ